MGQLLMIKTKITDYDFRVINGKEVYPKFYQKEDIKFIHSRLMAMHEFTDDEYIEVCDNYERIYLNHQCEITVKWLKLAISKGTNREAANRYLDSLVNPNSNQDSSEDRKPLKTAVTKRNDGTTFFDNIC